MANNNMMGIDALLKSYDNLDLSQGMLDINNKAAKSQKELDAAIDALLNSKKKPLSERTKEYARRMYGMNVDTEQDLQEQSELRALLGKGDNEALQALQGAKAGADIGATLAKLLPEKSERLAAGPRGFGVVGRK